MKIPVIGPPLAQVSELTAAPRTLPGGEQNGVSTLEPSDVVHLTSRDITSPWQPESSPVSLQASDTADILSSLGTAFALQGPTLAQPLSRRVGIGVAIALSLVGTVGLSGCSASSLPSQSTSQVRVRPLVSETDPILHTPAAEVTTFDDSLRQTLNDMEVTMRVDGGIGLAAPQVGVSQRLIVVRAGNGLVKMVNPRIVSRSGDVVSTEGCLSLPGRQYTLHRATHVVVEAQDENGHPVTRESKGMEAVVLQHEIDHLDGVTIADRGKPY